MNKPEAKTQEVNISVHRPDNLFKNKRLETKSFVESHNRIVRAIELQVLRAHEQLDHKVSEQSFNCVDRLKIRQKAFEHLAREVLEGEEMSKVEQRILQSDLTALHFLLVDDGIEQLSLSETSAEQLELSADQRSALAAEFVEHARTRNQEAEILVGQNESPVILGLEAEYDEFLQFERPRLLADSPLKSEDNLAQVDIVRTDIEPYGATELKTHPSASPKTQLRDIAHVASAEYSGLHEAKLMGVHENYSGVELSPEHTEMMDIFAIETACGLARGYLYENENSEYEDHAIPKKLAEAKAMLAQGKPYVREVIPKASRIKGKYYYFSDHRVKNVDEKVYRKEEPPENYPDNVTPHALVERRLNLSFSRGQYPRFVKEVTFSYLAARGIQAAQTENPNLQQEQLRKAWKEMMIQWDQLLSNKGIENPNNDQRFLGPFDNIEDFKQAMRFDQRPDYDLFISRLAIQANEDEEFRKAVYAMVVNYRKTAKKILAE